MYPPGLEAEAARIRARHRTTEGHVCHPLCGLDSPFPSMHVFNMPKVL
jgi:hypothetical protein